MVNPRISEASHIERDDRHPAGHGNHGKNGGKGHENAAELPVRAVEGGHQGNIGHAGEARLHDEDVPGEGRQRNEVQHADEDGRRNGQAADKAERDIPAHLHAFPVDAAQDDTDEDKGQGGRRCCPA